MFEPVLGKQWVGLLRIPQGILALLGPTIGGWFVDNMSWRHLYWLGVPFLVVCLFLVPMGVPPAGKTSGRKIDVLGALLVAIASSTTILGLSFAGTTYPWGSVQIVSLLGVALLFWVLFFRAEEHAEEPIMDPRLLQPHFSHRFYFGMLSSPDGNAHVLPIHLQGKEHPRCKAARSYPLPF